MITYGDKKFALYDIELVVFIHDGSGVDVISKSVDDKENRINLTDYELGESICTSLGWTSSEERKFIDEMLRQNKDCHVSANGIVVETNP